MAFRPRVEFLEGREVPATNVWLGGPLGDPASWSLSRFPVASDDVVCDGDVSNDSLAMPGGFAASFNSVQLINGYDGTVSGGGGGGSLTLGLLRIESGTLAGAGHLSVGTLEMEGGSLSGDGGGMTVDTWEMAGGTVTAYGFVSANTLTMTGGTVELHAGLDASDLTLSSGTIDQMSSGADITVTSDLTWTGGTLNSTNHASTVTVLGSGTIAPVNNGTVELGSNLEFIGTQAEPTASTIDPGTIVMINAGINLVVGPYSVLTARTYTEGQIVGITVQQKNAQEIRILPNATLWYIGLGQITNNLPISNVGGRFKLSGNVRVNLSGGGDGIDKFDYSQTGEGSDLHIENGSVLSVQHKMSIADGFLYPIMNPALPATAQTATINGTFNILGGTIIFSPPIVIGTDPIVYGSLTVNGSVNWTGGTYKPSVDYTTAGLGNKWIVNGTMTSAAACIVEPNPQRGQNPPASSIWKIMEARATAGALPSLPMGNPLSIGSFNEGPGKVWKLSS